MKKITAANWKGGPGKTTITAAMIKALSLMGKTILIIDIDCNCSISSIFNAIGKTKTSIDLLNGDIKDVISPVDGFDNIDIIPSDLLISRQATLYEKTLSNVLKKMDLSKYDFVFIDPPGTMNALTRNAVCAVDHVIVPAMPSEIDFNATNLFLSELEMMELDVDLDIIMNGFDIKKNSNDIFEKFSDEWSDYFWKIPIPLMKSLHNLTDNITEYKLQGRARKIIDDFVENVILEGGTL